MTEEKEPLDIVLRKIVAKVDKNHVVTLRKNMNYADLMFSLRKVYLTIGKDKYMRLLSLLESYWDNSDKLVFLTTNQNWELDMLYFFTKKVSGDTKGSVEDIVEYLFDDYKAVKYKLERHYEMKMRFWNSLKLRAIVAVADQDYSRLDSILAEFEPTYQQIRRILLSAKWRLGKKGQATAK